MLESFLRRSRPSLKICGVTLAEDAEKLARLGVDALGVNFWPHSKRYLPPSRADFLAPLAGRILRVGVWVNPVPEEAVSLYRQGLIDVIQLHGDEQPGDTLPYQTEGIPYFKAIGVRDTGDLTQAGSFGARAILLDAHAPGVYGGTGHTIDWDLCRTWADEHPELPLILAGGITPANAASALSTARPCALDIASGAESSPGIKDFSKVQALLDAVRSAPSAH